jgi:hypothetical protein
MSKRCNNRHSDNIKPDQRGNLIQQYLSPLSSILAGIDEFFCLIFIEGIELNVLFNRFKIASKTIPCLLKELNYLPSCLYLFFANFE